SAEAALLFPNSLLASVQSDPDIIANHGAPSASAAFACAAFPVSSFSADGGARKAMRANESTCVVGRKVVLVPYRACHVAKYHSWMQDPWLQEATGSEPLGLEEEYSMQQRWRDDSDKCTFIVLDRAHIMILANTSGELPGATTGPLSGAPPETTAAVLAAAAAAVEGTAAAEGESVGCLRHSPSHLDGMCGDVNLFLNDPDHPTAAEVEVMIAEPSCRGRGMGREALQLMLAYAAWHLHLTTFHAKINDSNAPSLALFRSL
ncbi:unnamed protein product, partial [Closterium sp. NIES-54]